MEGLDSNGTAARYVYAIVPKIEKEDYGPIGILGNRVHTISYQDLSALVHDCPPEPYQGDAKTVEVWVQAHAQVVDMAWAEAGTILPMSFDVIVKPDEDRSATENLRRWLQREYANLAAKLDEFRGKVELGLQVLWEPMIIAERITESSPELGGLRAEMASKPRGAAYFFRHKLAEAIKKEMEAKASQDFRALYDRLRGYVEDIQVNKLKKASDKQMIANLSLLVRGDRIEALSQGLSEVEKEAGVEVRCTGPWPPYSFAAKTVPPDAEAGG